ncbi:DUF1194 domain-containing protein [Yoonia sediminilitoris]|uniref:Uncharacterized protein DUF1194 n=1 Tax=Yoonia sediminilitoris TaxID=1286148 RepID=A0A2T6KQ60_9RHOB|nr:DUF1194 domain-containing protein [Yoonia sediminilitoris]PUB18694.1 uncharacterized protein DUF1194 [Yoonia sediminilitoris]RCW98862.1 uncharacterized protein DUF1194 [Yoonia sediminilitoris]
MRHFILALFLASPLAAQEVDTDLELVLLADASGSIDADELAFQRQSYAIAITDPAVVAAIENTLYGSIAVTYVEWASNQATVVGWTRIANQETANGFADALIGPPRVAYGRNAIGSALLEGKRLIEENDITGLRRVIDFSGDSMGNSYGPPITAARDEVVAANITINALPILRDGRFIGQDLEQAYADNIIGGPNSFVLPAREGPAFVEAVRRKLILEIAGQIPTRDIAALSAE